MAGVAERRHDALRLARHIHVASVPDYAPVAVRGRDTEFEFVLSPTEGSPRVVVVGTARVRRDGDEAR